MTHHFARHAALLCAALALFILLPAQSAFAQDDAKTLLKYAPNKAGAVFGMNIDDARSSTFYKEGFKILKTLPEFKALDAALKEGIDLDIQKDIHSVVAIAPPPTSSKGAEETVVVIMSGKFDKKKIEAKLAEDKATTREVGKMKVYKSGDEQSEILIISDELIVLSTGKESYRSDAFKAAAAVTKKSKVQKKVKSLAKRVNTSKHMWFAADTSKATKSAPDQPELIAMTFDFSSGLAMKGLLRMKSEEEAQKVLAEFNENKAQFEGGAAMVGAPSFAKNFKMEAKKGDINVTSSMPDKEVKSLATWGLGMLQSSQR